MNQLTFDNAHSKIIEIALRFLEIEPACNFTPSIHFWNTVTFRVLWLNWLWLHPLLTIPNQKNFNQCLSYVNLYQHPKNHTISQIFFFFWRYSWLKNSAIWLAENILAYISRTKIFQNICAGTQQII